MAQAQMVAVVVDYFHLQQAVAQEHQDKEMLAQVQDIQKIMAVVVVALVVPDQVVHLLMTLVELVG